MPRPLILFIAFSLFSATVHAEDAKKPSPAVKRVLDKAVADVKKNRQEFDKANQKPLGEARKELEDLSTKLIKDGKAEEAGVILKQIGSLDADVMKMANAPEPLPVAAGGGRVQPQRPLLERMAGKWRERGTEYTIQPNGQVQKADGNHGTLGIVSPDVAEMTWRSGEKCRLRIVDDNMIAVTGVDKRGQPFPGSLWERLD